MSVQVTKQERALDAEDRSGALLQSAFEAIDRTIGSISVVAEAT